MTEAAADRRDRADDADLEGIDLVVFDKDGTLLDFHAMWGGWAMRYGARLDQAVDRPISARFFAAIGFLPGSGAVDPTGPLATLPSDGFRDLTAAVLVEAGLDRAVAAAIVEATWFAPDPVLDARPLGDLPSVFGRLRQAGRRIAVATTDDRGPTLETLAGLGVASLVDAVVCADEGIRPKPAADMVVHLCAALGIAPAATAVVGDSPVDLAMGRAAGAGLLIAVLSGVGRREDLAPLADVVLASVDGLAPGRSRPAPPAGEDSGAGR